MFTTPDFWQFVVNLRYMGVGMLGVFMIIGIIIGSTYLINFLSNKVSDAIANKKNGSSDD